MAARTERGMSGIPDGVRFSKGVGRLLKQARSLGIDPQRYLKELPEQPTGRVCVKGSLATLKGEVIRVRTKGGGVRGR